MVGVEFAVSVVAGLVLGDYIDGKVRASFPVFTLAGLVCGVTAGMALLLRTLKLKRKKDDGNDEE